MRKLGKVSLVYSLLKFATRSVCLRLDLLAKMHSSALGPGENGPACPLIHDHCRSSYLFERTFLSPAN